MLHHVDLQKQGSERLDRRCQGQVNRRQATEEGGDVTAVPALGGTPWVFEGRGACRRCRLGRGSCGSPCSGTGRRPAAVTGCCSESTPPGPALRSRRSFAATSGR